MGVHVALSKPDRTITIIHLNMRWKQCLLTMSYTPEYPKTNVHLSSDGFYHFH